MALLILMKNDRRITEKFRVMGTDVVVDLIVDRENQDVGKYSVQKIRSFFENMQKKFSRFDLSSELSYVNMHVGAFVHISPEFLTVLQEAIVYHHRTRGTFDPRIHDALICAGYDRDFHAHDLNVSTRYQLPCKSQTDQMNPLRDDVMIDHLHSMVMITKRIDLTGIVKGWTVDHAKDLIDHVIVKGCVIDAGGDMWVAGRDENEKQWLIGIEDISDEKFLMKIDGEGVATSGVTRRQWVSGGEKRHHLINPRNHAEFLFDISTVTVVSQTVTDADIWAKVLFLKGVKKGLAYANAHAIKAIFVDHDHNLYISQYAQENII